MEVIKLNDGADFKKWLEAILADNNMKCISHKTSATKIYRGNGTTITIENDS